MKKRPTSQRQARRTVFAGNWAYALRPRPAQPKDPDPPQPSPGLRRQFMYDELKRRIIETLTDEDQLGGPMQRVYPRAVIASLADSIVADAAELFQEELQKGQA